MSVSRELSKPRREEDRAAEVPEPRRELRSTQPPKPARSPPRQSLEVGATKENNGAGGSRPRPKDTDKR